MNAITLIELSKTYPGGKKAVDSVNINLSPGEVFGFLGPNGAGKTTTVKLLGGMLRPTGGSCSIFAIDSVKEPEKVHALCGVVTEHAQMYDSLTGIQNLICLWAFVIGKSETGIRTFKSTGVVRGKRPKTFFLFDRYETTSLFGAFTDPSA